MFPRCEMGNGKMLNPPYIYDGFTTIYFITLDGEVPKAGHVIEDITRKGVAGIAKKWVGYRGKPGRMRPVIDVVNAGYLTTLEIGLKESIGSHFTIRDHFERVWTNVMLIDADLVHTEYVELPRGGINGGSFLGVFEMTWETAATFY